MNIQERRKQWLAALRSGEYKQNRGSNVGADGSYCALGLALKLSGFYKVVGMKSTSRHLETHYGLSDGGRWYVIHMNDNKKLSFPEIADRMEEFYEDL